MYFASKYVYVQGEEDEREGEGAVEVEEEELEQGWHNAQPVAPQAQPSAPAPSGLSAAGGPPLPQSMADFRQQRSSGFLGGVFNAFSRSSSSSARAERPPPPPPANAPAAPRAPHKRTTYTREVDANVAAVRLGDLESSVALVTGEPTFCNGCRAVFSSFSKLQPTDQPSHELWICEFCGIHNDVCLEPEEKPTVASLDYLLEAPRQDSQQEANDDISVVFCIDISGSMCVTKEVSGEVRLKGANRADVESLRRLGDGDANQRLPNQRGRVTYISRLQCVQAAIDAQLDTMKKNHPNRRVGVVTFSSEVTVLGDGTQVPLTITGDKLHDYELCLADGTSAFTSHLAHNISETSEQLAQKIYALEEGGPTALGPALIASVGMAAQGKVGSKVIICTDGLANIGVGSLDSIKTPEERMLAEQPYQALALYAKSKGVSVSVITILGEECSIETLMNVAEQTGGEVERVDPLHLTDNFGNILENPVIASNVSVTMMIHKGLRFRGEENVQNENRIVREFGNVSRDTEVTFEYGVKSKEEMAALHVEQLQQLPFQVQIQFTRPNGMKCIRVVTQSQEVTRDRLTQERTADIALLSANVAQKSAGLAKKGKYKEAQINMHSNRKFLERATNVSENQESADRYSAYVNNMSSFDRHLHAAQQSEIAMGSEVNEDMDDAETISMARRHARNDEVSTKIWSAAKKLTPSFFKKSGK